jgi:hypothetical protein
MASIPEPPGDSGPVSGPRKRKIPLDDNGEPVKRDKKNTLGPRRAPKKLKTTPVKLKSITKTVAAPAKAPTKSVPAKAVGSSRTQSPSVVIEDVDDEEDLVHSVPPRNPRNILEVADGSDDEPVLRGGKHWHPLPAEPVIDDDASDDTEIVKVMSDIDDAEDIEENDEAELSLF